MISLGQCFRETMEVLTLDMQYCKEVTDEGVKGLAEALPTTNVKQLTLLLCYTKAGNESLIKLGECLPKTMEVLTLIMEGSKEVTNEGFMGPAERCRRRT